MTTCHLTGFKCLFQFNPESKLSKDDQFYNESPTANDKVHVLVCVIDANTASQIRDETVKKIRDIRMEASDLGENRNSVHSSLQQVFNRWEDRVSNTHLL